VAEQENVIRFDKFKKSKDKKMIATILIIAFILSIIIWDRFIENSQIADFDIPPSENTTYSKILSISPADMVEQIEDNAGRPILLHLYTTWCGICKKQLPVINEVARKFQNTDLKTIAIAIDKNIDDGALSNYLSGYGDIYFRPSHLLYNDGLTQALKKKGIKYSRIIPLTVLIAPDGKIIKRFTGYKPARYLERKIIKTLKNAN
jgi:thiol-disulfide isomerase/thioredoxin